LTSFYCPRPPRHPHSFPTRRSSDLANRVRHQSAEPGIGVSSDIRVRRGPSLSFSEPQAQDVQPTANKQARSFCFGIPHRQAAIRSEEHTSELQSLRHLVCRLLLEKK